jgi:hypothetical protein
MGFDHTGECAMKALLIGASLLMSPGRYLVMGEGVPATDIVTIGRGGARYRTPRLRPGCLTQPPRPAARNSPGRAGARVLNKQSFEEFAAGPAAAAA